MSPHHGSARREDERHYLEAVTDGVCLAIDALQAMGLEATAEALFARMFVTREALPSAQLARPQSAREPILP